MNSILDEGLKIMALGMVGVFFFLILMVFFMSISAKIIQKFSKSEELDSSEEGGAPKAHIAAISAAISSYLKISSRN